MARLKNEKAEIKKLEGSFEELPLEFNRAGLLWKEVSRTSDTVLYSGIRKDGKAVEWEIIAVRKASIRFIEGVPYKKKASSIS